MLLQNSNIPFHCVINKYNTSSYMDAGTGYRVRSIGLFMMPLLSLSPALRVNEVGKEKSFKSSHRSPESFFSRWLNFPCSFKHFKNKRHSHPKAFFIT